MNADLPPDLCIIGGGPGGFSLALRAAACGRSVVLVEKGALGGRRLTDAIPRHVLLAASRAATSARGAAGVHCKHPRPPFRIDIRKKSAPKWPGFTPPRSRKMPPLPGLLLHRRV